MKDEIKKNIKDYGGIENIVEILLKGLKKGTFSDCDEEFQECCYYYITNLQDRTKELETINEEHRKLNGTLRKTINEAIDYINEKSEEVELNFYGFPDKITSFRGSVSILLNILQGSDE